MDKIEYRAVIIFFVKESLTPNEINSKFIKVYGDSSLTFSTIKKRAVEFNPFKAKLNSIRRLLALVGAHHILHVSRIRVKRGRKSLENDPREGRPKVIGRELFRPPSYISDTSRITSEVTDAW
jgi:hypothetical protein